MRHVYSSVFIALILSLSVPLYSQGQATKAANKFQGNFPIIDSGQSITYKVILSEKRTWGYEIYVNQVPFIRQLSIPGKPGQQGFPLTNQAAAAAALVVEKLKKGESPFISDAELLQIFKAAQ